MMNANGYDAQSATRASVAHLAFMIGRTFTAANQAEYQAAVRAADSLAFYFTDGDHQAAAAMAWNEFQARELRLALIQD